MRVIADLHIHSRFSRATSPKLTPAYLDRWARIKGITLLGTGDCTHPLWLKTLREDLDDAEDGFYTLKEGVRLDFDAGLALTGGLPYPPGTAIPRFVLTGEISTIYKKGDTTRKVHHLVILSGFRTAAAFQTALERIGNIRSDGRPILGIDSRDLLALLLETDEAALLIPAHIWTPWFSALGAKSGFDSIEACYGDLTPCITAVETGLSSNPPMNWALQSLDRFSIISNSDAHAPEKLGREATVFAMDMRFSSLAAALHQESREAEVLETIEFFPQEGKYHYDGHRKCAVYRSPEAAAGSSAICPVCHKPLTRGVMGRVLELADFPVDECARCPPEYAGTNRRPYHSLIPLKELLGELLDVGSGSKKVEAAYRSLIEQGGSELSLLMDAPTKTLERLSAPGLSGERLALAIERMRQGAVSICPGYDGVYGIIRAFPPGKTGAELPGITPPEAAESGEAGNGFDCSGEEPRKTGKRETLPRKKRAVPDPAAEQPLSPPLFQAQPEQEQVICYEGKYALIVAGPGSGKTATLAARIARLFRQGTAPESIVAVSFTVKAAWELRERIARTLGTADASAACGITVGTFHSLCVSLLREQGERQGIPRDFTILKEAERDALLQGLCAELPGRTQPEGLGKYIESRKRFLLLPGEETPNLAAGRDFLGEAFRFPQVHAALEQGYGRYQARLRSRASLDFDDLVLETVRLLAADAAQASWYRERFRHILVDEYQDINFAQYVLIRLLAGEGPAVAALWVIGDPNQAIYRFRGSDPRFIDRFCSDYPEAVRFHLSRSFRCAVAISNAAGKLMDTPLTGADGEARLFRTAYPSEQAEAEGIARRISRLIGGTTFFALDSAIADGREGPALRGIGDCAILLRTLALAAPITKALGDHGIPFILSSEKPWWEEEPVCSLLAMLRNSSGAGTDRPTEAVRRAWDAFPRKARRKQDAAWEEQVERLISIAAWYDRLPLFLDTLTAGGATSGGELGREGVAIMSIHASKGLEFDQVFVPALEEGLLPFTVYDGKADEAEKAARLEEEKRLLYVAMTRARTGLYLSWARKRMFQGRKLENRRSHFLDTLESMIPLYEDQPRRRVDLQLRLF